MTWDRLRWRTTVNQPGIYHQTRGSSTWRGNYLKITINSQVIKQYYKQCWSSLITVKPLTNHCEPELITNHLPTMTLPIFNVSSLFWTFNLKQIYRPASTISQYSCRISTIQLLSSRFLQSWTGLNSTHVSSVSSGEGFRIGSCKH